MERSHALSFSVASKANPLPFFEVQEEARSQEERQALAEQHWTMDREVAGREACRALSARGARSVGSREAGTEEGRWAFHILCTLELP
jgi:hypothetical protein